jgi:hypothetical protein
MGPAAGILHEGSRSLGEDSEGWGQAWSETHSRSYGLSEGQAQATENRPGS